MRLESSLISGKESLLSHGTGMSSIADNLANVSTPGFKGSRPEFSDIIAGSVSNLFGGPVQGGTGVKTDALTIQHDQQGTLDITGRNLDAGISGSGWFVMTDGTENFYTRAGNFRVDDEGNLNSPSGYTLLGYTAASPEEAVAININDIATEATATTEALLRGNLNAQDPITAPPAAVNTFDDVVGPSSYVTTFEVVDSLGAAHEIQMYFYRTDLNTWTAQAYVDGEDIDGGQAGVPVLLGQGQIAVQGNGVQVEGVENILEIQAAWGGGANPGTIALDISNMTGFAGGSALSGVETNGITGGTVETVNIGENGQIIATLNTGQVTTIAEIALADFVNPGGLQKIGSNHFKQTTESGDLVVGRPKTEGLGEIVGGSLESSSVDQAREFIQMIQFQQGYRAGSQVIQTVSELISATIQIA